MNAQDRKKQIMKQIKLKEEVQVKDLAKLLNVSEMTVRRDLIDLEKRNLLIRTHGGAINPANLISQHSLSDRRQANITQKEKLALEASSHVDDQMVLFLDAGTTTMQILKHLYPFKQLTIVTYDLEIALNLMNHSDHKILLLGGFIDRQTKSSSSIETFNQLSHIYFDLAFIGTDAFDAKFAYSSSQLRSEIKTKIIKHAKKAILVSDSSKFDKKSIFKSFQLNEVDLIITDSTHTEIEQELLQTGIDLEFIQD